MAFCFVFATFKAWRVFRHSSHKLGMLHGALLGTWCITFLPALIVKDLENSIAVVFQGIGRICLFAGLAAGAESLYRASTRMPRWRTTGCWLLAGVLAGLHISSLFFVMATDLRIDPANFWKAFPRALRLTHMCLFMALSALLSLQAIVFLIDSFIASRKLETGKEGGITAVQMLFAASALSAVGMSFSLWMLPIESVVKPSASLAVRWSLGVFLLNFAFVLFRNPMLLMSPSLTSSKMLETGMLGAVAFAASGDGTRVLDRDIQGVLATKTSGKHEFIGLIYKSSIENVVEVGETRLFELPVPSLPDYSAFLLPFWVTDKEKNRDSSERTNLVFVAALAFNRILPSLEARDVMAERGRAALTGLSDVSHFKKGHLRMFLNSIVRPTEQLFELLFGREIKRSKAENAD